MSHQINFKLTAQDYLRYFKIDVKKSIFLFKDIIFFVAFLTSFVLKEFSDESTIELYDFKTNKVKVYEVNYFVHVAFLFVLLCFSILFFRYIVLRTIEKKALPSYIHPQKRELEILKNSVKLTTDHFVTYFNYNAFGRLENHNDYYFLYTKCEMVIILPKRIVCIEDFVKTLSSLTTLEVKNLNR